MGFIENIKLFIRERQIQLELEKIHRKREMVNLRQAKRIGIVYDASEEMNFKKVADLIRYFQGQGKIVKALGHLSYNIIPHYCNNMLTYDYFLKKEINWWGKPSNQFVKDFLAEEFDLLIDLNVSGIPSLRYVEAISMARFKVGLFNESYKDNYDFMIQLEEPNLNEFIKQIVHYLGMLNQDAL